MNPSSVIRRGLLLALTCAWAGQAHAAPQKPIAIHQGASGPVAVEQPATQIILSKGRGQIISLPVAVTDVMISNQSVADVQVRSPKQLYILGKSDGESSIFAITAAGKIVYSVNVRVTANINSVDDVLKLALPDADIRVTTGNGLVLLTGTVPAPEDVAEAERLAKSLVGETTQVINRLKTATPVQVSLQVRIAEVNRQFVRNLGVNLMSRDTTGGFLFGVAQGRNFGTIANKDVSTFPRIDASSLYGLPKDSVMLPMDPATGAVVRTPGTSYDLSALGTGAKTSLGLAGHVLGLDLASAIDLAENQGLATTLAQPNLTALSGETASFLAGGEIPIPMTSQLGQVSVQFKQYGVSLSFTPVVLADGRISLKVRPEVSQLTTAGSVQVNGFTIPALSTRRVETTVELGSGQSFMIGGLLQNTQNSVVDKAPGLGSLPILGALFRSTEFRKNETELVVIVTPFLVRPVSANDIALPTDGLGLPSDAARLLNGAILSGKSGAKRPMPSMAPAATIPAPGLAQMSEAEGKPEAAAPSAAEKVGKQTKGRRPDLPQPGFMQ